jgi:hypothetical protein
LNLPILGRLAKAFKFLKPVALINGSSPPIIILNSHNIVFLQIVPNLYLYQFEHFVSLILETVYGAKCNISAFV